MYYLWKNPKHNDPPTRVEEWVLELHRRVGRLEGAVLVILGLAGAILGVVIGK